ncbi:hypothetical protein F5Y05DRAFT_409553 [Hypoxylon sp. FL0543]|nr:hypothetical protein F5Y05DRAFT_409553 [Hypoxylon sp. FL0543]
MRDAIPGNLSSGVLLLCSVSPGMMTVSASRGELQTLVFVLLIIASTGGTFSIAEIGPSVPEAVKAAICVK